MSKTHSVFFCFLQTWLEQDKRYGVDPMEKVFVVCGSLFAGDNDHACEIDGKFRGLSNV